MKTIYEGDYRETLTNLGVNPLSGEGCQLGLRWDTDVSPQAAPLVEEWMGGMKLAHSGFNGWSVSPDGVYLSGASQAWDYINKVKLPGWKTDPGYCFKLPRSMLVDLLVFLLLKQPDTPQHLIRVESLWGEGSLVGNMIILLNTDERSVFADVGKERPDQNDRVAALAFFLKEQNARWRGFMKDQSGANLHHFSGKKIA